MKKGWNAIRAKVKGETGSVFSIRSSITPSASWYQHKETNIHVDELSVEKKWRRVESRERNTGSRSLTCRLCSPATTHGHLSADLNQEFPSWWPSPLFKIKSRNLHLIFTSAKPKHQLRDKEQSKWEVSRVVLGWLRRRRRWTGKRKKKKRRKFLDENAPIPITRKIKCSSAFEDLASWQA